LQETIDLIDATPYDKDIDIVARGKQHMHISPSEAAYWADTLCLATTSKRIKTRVVRQPEGQYMFKISQQVVSEQNDLPRSVGMASLFLSQASQLVNEMELLMKNDTEVTTDKKRKPNAIYSDSDTDDDCEVMVVSA